MKSSTEMTIEEEIGALVVEYIEQSEDTKAFISRKLDVPERNLYRYLAGEYGRKFVPPIVRKLLLYSGYELVVRPIKSAI